VFLGYCGGLCERSHPTEVLFSGATAVRNGDVMSTRSTAARERADRQPQGEPIVEQSPTVTVGDKTFVILPGPVATISARKTEDE
jgi:hypothetical protein